ncbi:NTE family protein [Bradyrhizobium japonicum]
MQKNVGVCGPNDLPGQVVLVLQGGGALGSYQAGVYQALHEAGIEPDWVIGTSIGAINGSLIAGNAPENRLARLKEFWKRMEQNPVWALGGAFPDFSEKLAYLSTVTNGIPGFFRPNPLAHAGDSFPLGADHAGFYSTAPLEKTLSELVDFDLANRCAPRLTVGAAHVGTSEMRYFDSRDGELTVKHVMASGALPPAFPAVRIDGELYWDGGILSNTPTEAVFDDNPRRDSLIFSVHLWNSVGAEPTTMAEVLNRHKDVQYSSRIASQIVRQQQAHRLRHVINQLAARLPESERNDPAVRELMSYGCPTRMHVVRLLAPQLDRETHTKDIDSVRRALRGAGMRATPIRGRCWRESRGSANSIRSPAWCCTSIWTRCRWRRSRAASAFIELPQALRIVGRRPLLRGLAVGIRERSGIGPRSGSRRRRGTGCRCVRS